MSLVLFALAAALTPPNVPPQVQTIKEGNVFVIRTLDGAKPIYTYDKDEPGKSIGWRSIEGHSEVGVSGNVTFSELGDGETEIHVVMQWYDTPAGAIGEAASRTLQNPEQMVEDDLRRFKDVAEGRMPYAA